jgi:hypothetical protein
MQNNHTGMQQYLLDFQIEYFYLQFNPSEAGTINQRNHTSKMILSGISDSPATQFMRHDGLDFLG